MEKASENQISFFFQLLTSCKCPFLHPFHEGKIPISQNPAIYLHSVCVPRDQQNLDLKSSSMNKCCYSGNWGTSLWLPIIFPNSSPTDFTRKQPYMWLLAATSHSTVCCLILHWTKSLSPDALEWIMPQDYRKKKSQVLGKSGTSVSRAVVMLHSIHEQTDQILLAQCKLISKLR